ncbi:hypothetical protein P692DRAFT_20819962 [Suillus brevipes Sb2]|nr:hypothetical protein P692DRAFT_20819962 [Suillus brevipes Sb2]
MFTELAQMINHLSSSSTDHAIGGECSRYSHSLNPTDQYPDVGLGPQHGYQEDVVFKVRSELDIRFHPSGAAAESSLDVESEDTELLDLEYMPLDVSSSIPNGQTETPCRATDQDSHPTAELDLGLHNPSIEMPDEDLMLDDVAALELGIGCHPSGAATASSLNIELEDMGDGSELDLAPYAPNNPIPAAADLHKILPSDTGQAQYSPTSGIKTGPISPASQ